MAMGQVFQLLGQLVNFLTLLANDHAHPGRVNIDDDLLACPLDAHLGDARALPRLFEALLDEAADLEVFDKQLCEILLAGKPVASPGEHDARAKAGGAYFLAHKRLPSSKRSRDAVADAASIGGKHRRCQHRPRLAATRMTCC